MPSPLASAWTLDPAVAFLNHGSFGACPRDVLAAQTALRARMEREPVLFLGRELEGLLDSARAALAAFVGATPSSLALVTNATQAVNAVLRSLTLSAGDELVVTDHEYNATRTALDFAAGRAGAKVVVARLPFPIASSDQAIAPILEAITPRTRLVVVDHVTSPTALVLPLERLVRELAARGVDTLVDGAHAVGMLPLSLDALGAAYYTSNCHKWLCAPKGAAFLYVRPDRQGEVRPTSISHGANSPRGDRSRFLLEFDWTGTLDPTPWLCIPEAIRVVGALVPGGWPEVMKRNRALALEARALVGDALGVAPACPNDLVGSLAAVVLPDAREGFAPLTERLYERHRVEVPANPFPAWPRRVLRLSAQLYNAREDYQRLAAALAEELRLESRPREAK